MKLPITLSRVYSLRCPQMVRVKRRVSGGNGLGAAITPLRDAVMPPLGARLWVQYAYSPPLPACHSVSENAIPTDFLEIFWPFCILLPLRAII